jgi:hypothetical protein
MGRTETRQSLRNDRPGVAVILAKRGECRAQSGSSVRASYRKDPVRFGLVSGVLEDR